MPAANATAPAVERTCPTCPAFVSGPSQTRLIGSNIGSPMCGRKMLPLVMPNQPPDVSKKVMRGIAKGCSMFGEDVNMTPLAPTASPPMRIGMDGHAMEVVPDNSQTYANCATCTHAVPSNVVRSKTGWTGTICKRNGWLMPDSRLGNYAKGCGTFKAHAGVKVDPLSTFTFFPQFSPTFGEVNAARQFESSLDNFVDPREWPTDRPVSDRARITRGIRAWRKISDPKGYGDDVYLPVFDRDAQVMQLDGQGKPIAGSKKPLFDEAALSLIPQTGDREAPEQYADHSGLLYTFAVLWIKLDETPAAWGMGGTGKTEIQRHIAWLMQLPLRIIAIDGSSEIDSVAGKILFEQGETRPHYGTLPTAWSNANVLLIDEPNTGPVEIWQMIRGLTDLRQTLHLAHLKDERIKRHVDCYPAMAMNPQWHPLNIGAQMVGDADISRLSHVYFDYPPRDLEMAILRRRVMRDGWEVPTAKLEKVMDAANDLRQMSNEGIIHTSWGIRHQIKLTRSLRWFDPVTAYRRAIGDAMEPSQWEQVMSVVASHFGD
jgi:MoxR-like ATPase